MFRHLSVNAILEDTVPQLHPRCSESFYCGGWEHGLKSLVFMSIYIVVKNSSKPANLNVNQMLSHYNYNAEMNNWIVVFFL